MLREFGLVDLQQNLSTGGGSDVLYKKNLVSEAGRHIFGKNMEGWIHGGNKGGRSQCSMLAGGLESHTNRDIGWRYQGG